MDRAIISLVVCLAVTLYGQSAGPRRFEVVSIKPSNAGPNSSSGISTRHDRLDANNVTLKRCIMGAYGIGPNQISGGPDWLTSDRFEISAKADQQIDDDAVFMVMLQSVLTERFKLVFHRETKTLPALVLEVGKNGAKLEKSEQGDAGTNTTGNNTSITIDAHHTNMDLLAKVLARETALPVVNHTALDGIFNFKLRWRREDANVDGTAPEGPSLFTAIQEQLGLRLRSEKAPVEILVIDHVEKPSEN